MSSPQVTEYAIKEAAILLKNVKTAQNLPPGTLPVEDLGGGIYAVKPEPRPVEDWVTDITFHRLKDPYNNGEIFEIAIILVPETGVSRELRMLHNTANGINTYSVDDLIITCEMMQDLVHSILPALECLPLSLIDGPFKELDEALRRDRSMQEKKRNRFNDLEIENEQDTTGNSDTDIAGDQEGEGSS